MSKYTSPTNKSACLIAFGIFTTITCIPTQAGEPEGKSKLASDTVYYDYIDALGQLSGGVTELTFEFPEVGGGSIGIINNRIDLVAVGDGYTNDELDIYAQHAADAIDAFFSTEPFARYQTLFNVHVVDVVSNESGVDHDPTFGTYKDTAMDMGFWCEGIERLLCVNVSKAYSFANTAPEVDQVLAIANSGKYGGAGYTTFDLATVAGGNSFSPEVAIHEFGHSIGNLADEYDYGGGVVYAGNEPTERNVSIHQESAMAALGTKWAAWLGHNDSQFDGLISTYEGARYYEQGIYRPTFNSKMRNLGRPFNLPSIESLIIEIYKTVLPIDDAAPLGTVSNSAVLWVDPVDPIGYPLDVQWYVDNEPLAGAVNTSLDVSTLCLPTGDYVISVTVTDGTNWVRDELARAQWMSQSVSWNTRVQESCVDDIDLPHNGYVDVNDLRTVILLWGTDEACADIAPPGGDGIVNVNDLRTIILNWGPCG